MASDREAVAAGLVLAADGMAATLTQLPAQGCGLNARHEAVCEDTGDGFADRYGDPDHEPVRGGS